MTTQKIARRKPWRVGLLQLVLPGLGNLYTGRPRRALISFVALRCISFALIVTVLWLPGLLSLAVFLLLSLFVTVLLVLDGVRCARAADANYRLARYNRWYVYVLVVVVVAVIDSAFVLNFSREHIYQAQQPLSAAMEPAMLPGDHFFADKTAYLFSAPARGDLVVYQPPREVQVPSTFVKRIVGMPGETIEIRDRAVFINGQKLDEPYVQFLRPPTAQTAMTDSWRPTLIPDNAYFLLGDNRDNSLDSRFIGPLQRELLLGKAKTVFFSQDPETGEIRWRRIGMVPR